MAVHARGPRTGPARRRWRDQDAQSAIVSA